MEKEKRKTNFIQGFFTERPGRAVSLFRISAAGRRPGRAAGACPSWRHRRQDPTPAGGPRSWPPCACREPPAPPQLIRPPPQQTAALHLHIFAWRGKIRQDRSTLSENKKNVPQVWLNSAVIMFCSWNWGHKDLEASRSWVATWANIKCVLFTYILKTTEIIKVVQCFPFEKTLMLGKIEGGRRRGWQRMR